MPPLPVRASPRALPGVSRLDADSRHPLHRPQAPRGFIAAVTSQESVPLSVHALPGGCRVLSNRVRELVPALRRSALVGHGRFEGQRRASDPVVKKDVGLARVPNDDEALPPTK